MEELITAVYNEDLTIFKANVDLFNVVWKGWSVIHYLVDTEWTEGIDTYLSLGGDINLKTEDEIISSGFTNLFIIGGRNALFNSKIETLTQYLLEKGMVPCLDFNGNSYINSKNVDNNKELYKENYNQVASRINSKYRNNSG